MDEREKLKFIYMGAQAAMVELMFLPDSELKNLALKIAGPDSEMADTFCVCWAKRAEAMCASLTGPERLEAEFAKALKGYEQTISKIGKDDLLEKVLKENQDERNKLN